MSRRIFNTLSLISAILLGCTVILWAWSFRADPRKDYLSFSGDFHVVAQNGRMDFFNVQIGSGPFHASTFSLGSSTMSAHPLYELRG